MNEEQHKEAFDKMFVQGRNQRQRLAWALLINALTVLVLGIVGLFYINYVDQKRAADERRNDQEWCELIVLYDDYFKANPPMSELGQKQAEYMSRRRGTLEC